MVTLTFSLPEQMFQMALLLLKKSMHKYRSYGPDKLTLWPLQVWPWPSTYLKQDLSQGQDDNYAKLLYNPCINVEVISQQAQLWPFYYMTIKCDLDLQPTSTNVSNGNSTPQEQLCQIILKFVHKCRSNGPDKLNLWSFAHQVWPWPSNLPEKMFQMALLLLKKSMHKYRSYGPYKLTLWPLQVWPWPSNYLKQDLSQGQDSSPDSTLRIT